MRSPTLPETRPDAAGARFVRAADLAKLRRSGSLVAQTGGFTLALFAEGERVYAVENRCPHMGFPLHRGTLRDGILTCHWHHARFDLASGGTFDQWADDARAFPVSLRDGEVWVDVAAHGDPVAHQRRRLREGLERDLPLVIAKAVLALDDAGVAAAEPVLIGLEFGTRFRAGGWGRGLTALSCLVALLPQLDREDRRRALYHGLAETASESAGTAPHFPIRPLPGEARDASAYKRWFRQFVAVRDADGAERCLVSAVRDGATPAQLADLLFTAATDFRYVTTGHVLDFTNKALEALDATEWADAEHVLASLADLFAHGERMEEANAWRHPVDVVALVEAAAERVPEALAGARRAWSGRDELVQTVLGEDPRASIEVLLEALAAGADPVELAGAVAEAAATRIARFHTSNKFDDWDTALHTFTFANAVQQGLRRTIAPELVRGILDAAMSVYLDRFLNVPPAKLSEPDGTADPAGLLAELPLLLDRQQQVDEAGALVAAYLAAGGEPAPLLAALGAALLRENRNFHTIQMLEASVRQWADTRAPLFLVAAARYLAAHAPTTRAQAHTFTIAQRLQRSERLYEDV